MSERVRVKVAVVDWDNFGPTIEIESILREDGFVIRTYGVCQMLRFGRVTPPKGSPCYVPPIHYYHMQRHLFVNHPDFFREAVHRINLAYVYKNGPEIFQTDHDYPDVIISIGVRTQRELNKYFRSTGTDARKGKVTVFNITKLTKMTVSTVITLVYRAYKLDTKELEAFLDERDPSWAQRIRIFNYHY